MADHEPYVILDIKGLIQHAYHAGKDPEALLEEDGTHVTTASHGFHTFLEFYPVFSEVPPRRIIAVWDGDNSYRRSLFPGYKAKRAAKNKEEKQNKPLQTGEI
jgi:5'-3' exonuclease